MARFSHGATAVTITKLSHLSRLEAESIHILREVVAECERPVMLYSIGKDSSVMLHLALKAFFPAKPPFPLLHVDTTWKFRQMIEFRDLTARRLGMDLIVHVNPDGVAMGINPFVNGSALYTYLLTTRGLRPALGGHGFEAAWGAMRKNPARRSVCFRSVRRSIAGIRSGSGRNCGGSITPASPRARACGCSRCRTGPNSISGSTSIAKALRWYRCTLPPNDQSWSATAC